MSKSALRCHPKSNGLKIHEVMSETQHYKPLQCVKVRFKHRRNVKNVVLFALAVFCLKEEKLFEILLACVGHRWPKYLVLFFPSHAQGVYSIRTIFEVFGGINFMGVLKFEKPDLRVLLRKLPLPKELTIVRGEDAAIRRHRQVATLCSTKIKFSF